MRQKGRCWRCPVPGCDGHGRKPSSIGRASFAGRTHIKRYHPELIGKVEPILTGEDHQDVGKEPVSGNTMKGKESVIHDDLGDCVHSKAEERKFMEAVWKKRGRAELAEERLRRWQRRKKKR